MRARCMMAAAVLAAVISPGLGATGLDWGGDIRVRFTMLDEISTQVPGLSLDQGFNRDRIRLWLDYKPTDDITLMARIINEFRFYDNGRRQAPDAWDPMTEVLPDQLYMDFRNLAGGKLAVKAGRQTVKYGTGKIFADGTQNDGSRTDFVDGVKLSLTLGKHNIDLLGLYSAAQPGMVINDQDRYLSTFNSQIYGLYGSSKQFEQVPFEYYWVY